MKREILTVSILTAASFGLFYLLRTPFGGDWDSYDFIWQIVTHRNSNLGFGRLYYIAYNIPIWEAAHRLFGVPLTEAYKVIQLATLCMGSGALVFYYLVLKRLLDKEAALLGALFLMTSPFYIIYAGFIMTEIPMLFFLLLGLLFHLKGIEEGRRGWIALGSAMLGTAIGVRENAFVFVPLFFALPFIRSRNRSGHGWSVMACTLLPAFLLAMAGPLWLLWKNPVDYPMYVNYWLSKVPRNHTLDWTLVGFLVMYMFLNAPVGTVLLPPALIEVLRRWRERVRGTPADPGILYNASYQEIFMIGLLMTGVPYLVLLGNADMKHYARYALIGVPGIAMLAGLYINNSAARLKAGRLWKYALAVGVSGLVLLAGSVPMQALNETERRRKEIIDHLYKNAPENAVFLPGSLTPLIEAYRQMDIRPQWEMIASGWPWPGRENLPSVVKEILQSERPIYFISDPDHVVWRYLEQEQGDINCLRDQFQFEPVDDYLVRLKPKSGSDEE